MAATAGVLAAIVLAELGYRALRLPGLSPTTSPAYVEHDDELGWRYRPNAHERHRSDEFDVEVATNARGFRGSEWPAGTGTRPCILVLGDSFAFGWGVKESQSFTGRLAARHAEWDVRNAAVSGYGTDQELLLLRRLAPELKPDLVVCVFCENDLFESSSPVVYGKHKPWFERVEGTLVLRGVPVPETWLERTSFCYCAWTKWRWERAFVEHPVDRNGEWAVVCDLYRAMRDELGGVGLLLVSDQPRLADLAREERGIGHVDVQSVLDPKLGPWTYPRDGHWTPKAHERIAEALELEIVKRLASRGK